ncbi:hypothetical protein M409DRAFT_49558 [Zasmidium cellare ATCC 36951]|uniref:Uncharacterized protein n=1 Tax=Zasmidium cellare ATCC 36951 TaxID=1080233 RepID=A0A6A6D3T5_ZASCE|nr:uncharacterized protein M409DRAFT_49558 [Zasmidium cellare ATCC 36951]KAF2173060.1 hypothetical protein M409DRAFT_49558 [Zasmidium cellare ATCC 36951]
MTMDAETYTHLTGNPYTMDTSSSTTSLGPQAVPRELFHEASWRTIMYNQTTENEMAGFGTDQQQQNSQVQVTSPTDPSMTDIDLDIDDDLDVTAELQQQSPSRPQLTRVNSFDFVLHRANQLASEQQRQQQGYSNSFDLALTPPPPPSTPVRAHTTPSLTASSTPYEEIEMRDLLAPPPPPAQTRSATEGVGWKNKVWGWCTGVCGAYSEVVMRESVGTTTTATATSSWRVDGGVTAPRRTAR